MAEKTKQVDSVQLLADIKKCCEKHGVRVGLLRFNDEIKEAHSHNFLELEIWGAYDINTKEKKDCLNVN